MRLLTTIAAALILGACSASRSTDADGWSRVVGTIMPEMSSVQMLQVPPTVTAGVPFSITVSTMGSSTCTRAAGMEASLNGLTLDVTPYDSVPTTPIPCTRDLRSFPRSLTHTFNSAGTAMIRVHGKQGDRPITYEAQVTVRPRS